MNKLSASGRTPHHPLSRENHACCNLVLQLRVSIYKTNNLQKEKGFPGSVWVMEFQSGMFLQLKLRNAVNFIFTFHSHTDKCVKMISTSHGGTLKHAVALCLRRWIPNPGVPCSKPLGGSKGNSAFHPTEDDQLSTRNSWKPGNCMVKRELFPRSGSVALRQLNPIHKKGS